MLSNGTYVAKAHKVRSGSVDGTAVTANGDPILQPAIVLFTNVDDVHSVLDGDLPQRVSVSLVTGH